MNTVINSEFQYQLTAPKKTTVERTESTSPKFFLEIKEGEELKTTQYPTPHKIPAPELVIFGQFNTTKDNARQKAMFENLEQMKGAVTIQNLVKTPTGDFYRVFVPPTEQNPAQYIADLLGPDLTFWWPAPKREGEPEYKQKKQSKKNKFSNN